MPELRRLQLSAEHAGASAQALEFRVGTFSAPVTLGERADVIVAGAGVAQARVYFDGSTLFVCSVSVEHPVIVDEAALGTLWAPVFCPSLLQLGEAKLDYQAAHAEVRPARRKLFPDPWAGSTMLMSTLEPAKSSLPRQEIATATVLPRQNAGFETVTVIAPFVPTLDQFEALDSTEVPRSPSAPPAELVTAEVRRSRRSRLKERVLEDFRRTPRNIRVTLFALPVIAWAALSLGDPVEPAPAPPAKTAAARLIVPASPAEPKSSLVPAPSSVATQPAIPVAPGPTLMRGKRSLEASAADAAAHGAYQDSARLYLQLAQASPGRPEFASAARILQSKRAPP